jgi:hypothetical protein
MTKKKIQGDKKDGNLFAGVFDAGAVSGYRYPI